MTWETRMHHRILPTGMLALALAFAPAAASAQAAAAPPADASSEAVDPATIAALKKMGAHLQTLRRFRVTTDLTGERVLADGQKLQHSASAQLDVQRPNKLRARMSSARAERELFYDGKEVALFTPAQPYYAKVPFTGSLDELVDRMQARYGVEMPLSDMFVWGTPAAPLDNIESAMNAGQDFVGDDLCDHYAMRQGTFDWQIWITVGDRPLPRKLVITSRSDEARPQSVSLIEWNLKPGFADSAFTFKPPKGAKAIEMLPRKGQ
jgi:hypothetical protein